MSLEDLPGETWSVIPIPSNFPYFASSLGRIKIGGHYRKTGSWIDERIARLTTSSNGYLKIGIDGGTYYVHRLIGLTFLHVPDGVAEIDHINTVRTDNRLENIRWVTHIENMGNPLNKNKRLYRDGSPVDLLIKQMKKLGEKGVVLQ